MSRLTDFPKSNDAATTGALAASFLWSDWQNSTDGVPINGDDVDGSATSKMNNDDPDRGLVVTGASLAIGVLVGAEAATYGGELEVLVAPPGPWQLDYGFNVGIGTFALAELAAGNAFQLADVAAGDVIERPCSTVSQTNSMAGVPSITIDTGVYDFTDLATIQSGLASYSARIDAVTGLVAVTSSDVDMLQPTVRQSGGRFNGDFLWSDADNWTDDIPANGATLGVGATGFDDLAALQVAGLTLDDTAAATTVDIVGASLTVADLRQAGTLGTGMLVADATDAGTPVTVTLLGAELAGAVLAAQGAGSRLLDEATSDLASNTYQVTAGGLVELTNVPLASDVFSFVSAGTFAFKDPGATVAALLLGVATGSSIELPGTAVTSVTYGAGQLSVTTDAGAVAFSSVSYAQGIVNDAVGTDAGTGLASVTFRGVDQFAPLVKNSGPGVLNGRWVWSDAGNWTEGVPIDGDSVTLAVDPKEPAELYTAIDDLPALNLAVLDQRSREGLSVDTGILTIGTLLVIGSTQQGESGLPNSGLEADSYQFSAPTPVTVTIDNIVGTGGGFTSNYAESRLIINAPTDPGEEYQAQNGGFIELVPTPAPQSSLRYYFESGTIALLNPGSIIASTLDYLAAGEVLELPGTTATAVTFGSSSLTVTTDIATFVFSDVIYDQTAPIVTYSAAPDPTTGLVAVTFAGPDIFSQKVAATSGPYEGFYLWSNAANWSWGIPIDGAVVSTAVYGIDDLPSLTLSALTLDFGAHVVVTNATLAIGTVTAPDIPGGFGGALGPDNEIYPTGPATVITGTIVGIYNYGGEGPDTVFIDRSPTDAGEYYNLGPGDLFELAAPLSDASYVTFSTPGTLALQHPSASSAAKLVSLQAGDVIELPGVSVSQVIFGASFLTITTDAGGTKFTNVTYKEPAGEGPDGYTAAPDLATGLEAITLTGPDNFTTSASIAGGLYAGSLNYNWNTPANWSDGIPVDGDSVNVVTGPVGFIVDDLGKLAIATLTVGASDGVYVIADDLTVQTVIGAADGGLEAVSPPGVPVTVAVGTLTGQGGYYGAQGPDDRFIDRSASDPGEIYRARIGGFTELLATPSDASTFTYDTSNGSSDTFAFATPAASSAALLEYVQPGDVLELPGATVSNVTYGATGLNVTTDAGSYAFTNVAYTTMPTGFTEAVDASTGLVAITFTGPDVFEENVKAANGPLSGYYLWSNAANWSNDVPLDGDSVTLDANENGAVDDLPALTLASLALNGGQLFVVGTSLTVTTVAAGGSSLVAGLLVSTPVTVTLGTVTGANGATFADGPGSRIVDQSSTDPVAFHKDFEGGLTELSAPPNPNSTLAYNENAGNFALANPGATDAATVAGLAPGDVLELPGMTVSNVTYGATSLNVTTDAGTYAFTNVIYGSAVTGYTAAPDASTGLVAITFTRQNLFQPNVQQAGSTIRWSDGNNWTLSTPADGDSVTTAASGIDDISGLTLTALVLTGDAEVQVTANSLDVTTATGSAGTTLLADAADAGTQVTVTVGTIAGQGGTFGADGASGDFIDRSAVDAGEAYLAANGGTVELAAALSDLSGLTYSGLGTIALLAPGEGVIATPLAGVGVGDVLELPGATVDAVSFGAASLSVTTDLATYDFADVGYRDGQVPGGWSASVDSVTGLEAVTIACFCQGTRIATPTGETPVEQLRVGDHVMTAAGAARPIRWVGRAAYRRPFGDRDIDLNPIRIVAGALAVECPTRDLHLSPEHGVFLGGVLIPAKRLVNGTTIRQVPVDTIAYFHVELASHDVVLADGVPCESYLDTGNRHAFTKGGAAVLADCAGTEICEAVREARSCAPMHISGPLVARVDAGLRARARQLGHLADCNTGQRSAHPGRTSIDLAHLLQPAWYLAKNGDVAASGMDAARHYAGWGREEGRLPCHEIDLLRRLSLIDPATLVITMSDVVAAGEDPVVHFATSGWRERRRPNAYFDTGWYLGTHRLSDDVNPLLHYVLSGEREGLRPSRHFDPVWYRQRYRLSSSVLALAHYLKHRRTQRFSPLPGFDLAAHKRKHGGTMLPNRDPYLHFLACDQRHVAAEAA